jgi:branched-chain amino acid transport system permease protein
MVFMVMVGGLGTFEGPILGAILFFIIQDRFGESGVWYLVALGAAAIFFALFVPRGLWGTIEDRFGLRLMPVGYRLRIPDAAARPKRSSAPGTIGDPASAPSARRDTEEVE